MPSNDDIVVADESVWEVADGAILESYVGQDFADVIRVKVETAFWGLQPPSNDAAEALLAQYTMSVIASEVAHGRAPGDYEILPNAVEVSKRRYNSRGTDPVGWRVKYSLRHKGKKVLYSFVVDNVRNIPKFYRDRLKFFDKTPDLDSYLEAISTTLDISSVQLSKNTFLKLEDIREYWFPWTLGDNDLRALDHSCTVKSFLSRLSLIEEARHTYSLHAPGVETLVVETLSEWPWSRDELLLCITGFFEDSNSTEEDLSNLSSIIRWVESGSPYLEDAFRSSGKLHVLSNLYDDLNEYLETRRPKMRKTLDKKSQELQNGLLDDPDDGLKMDPDGLKTSSTEDLWGLYSLLLRDTSMMGARSFSSPLKWSVDILPALGRLSKLWESRPEVSFVLSRIARAATDMEMSDIVSVQRVSEEIFAFDNFRPRGYLEPEVIEALLPLLKKMFSPEEMAKLFEDRHALPSASKELGERGRLQSQHYGVMDVSLHRGGATEFTHRDRTGTSSNLVSKSSFRDQGAEALDAVGLGLKLAAANEAGEVLVDIAKELVVDSPMLQLALESPDGREVAKLLLAFLVQTGAEQTDLVPKADLVSEACKLQMTASSFTLVAPRLNKLRKHFTKLARIGAGAKGETIQTTRVRVSEDLREELQQLKSEVAVLQSLSEEMDDAEEASAEVTRDA